MENIFANQALSGKYFTFLGRNGFLVEKNYQIPLPEVIFGSSDTSKSLLISRMAKSGKIRKIAPRIYSSNLHDDPKVIVRRNLFLILSELFPGALLSHRSAFEYQPTSTDQIYLTYGYSKKIKLPGLTVQLLIGPEPTVFDHKFFGELYVSNQARAFLENLQNARNVSGTTKALRREAIEEKLDTLIRLQGEDALNELREQAKLQAEKLEMLTEYMHLNKIIGALLNTRPNRALSSSVALARAYGEPYDPNRLQLFEQLFLALRNEQFPLIHDQNNTKEAFSHFSFFEAYFSNYIEGTEFDLEEAKNIIETSTPLPNRDEDSHDILGTFQLVSNPLQMRITPVNKEHLFELLKSRHGHLMKARPTKQPGMFKDKTNRAGETFFVEPNLVKGTLSKGLEFYFLLEHPFARAAFIKFLISEVHPFLDGNGRLARVMMNAELVKNAQSKIIIPTVYRDDYLGALRRLSRQNDPRPYIKMLLRVWQFSGGIYSDDMLVMQKQLEKANAFKEHNEAKLLF